ncbi:MAG TPA: hypothetical protein VHU19_07150 [Pyrinomonadaceae bacterium]|jgi:hypothetical protein|nr:hypothetical protein [Pyrinomonadaceae bacterium]
MKSIQSKGKIGRAVLTLSLLLGVGITSGVTAQAQYQNDRGSQYQRDRDQRDRDRNDNGREHRGRNWDRYGQYGGSFQLRQTALNAGYNEGIKQGRKDRNRRGRSDFRDSSAYRNADHDYSSRLGDKELYRRYYREGYENGYNDGRNGN